jgi:hypothetical protein
MYSVYVAIALKEELLKWIPKLCSVYKKLKGYQKRFKRHFFAKMLKSYFRAPVPCVH